MKSAPAPSVPQYLASLPPERRKVMTALRRMIRAHLPRGYEERMGYGMISYLVPLKRYPDTYNGQPLCYVALAAQKNNYSLYLMSAYQDPKETAYLRKSFAAAGKRLDMGKSCIRFRALDDLPLDVVGKVIAATSVDAYIERHEQNRRATTKPARRTGRKPAAG